MTPERWAQIEELFHRAAQCDPKQRTSLLDASCQGDGELRRQVEQLLAADKSAAHDLKAAFRDGLEEISFPLLGETVSHYRIIDAVGGGGMGLVYKAEDLKLGRQVAIKFLPEESAQDPDALGRFEREARSASSLEHPNICPIYEFGEHEGQPFLVMQLLQGKTLRELISERAGKSPAFETSELIDLALQICEGLEAAHGRGIIHRDIKPANIFVTDQGQAKILDFGLAKLSRAGEEGDLSDRAPKTRVHQAGDSDSGQRGTPDYLLSRTGRAMGTAGYMSPEQARGEKLDVRTDLFSLGLVLYEMATGRRAFAGDSGSALHEAILGKNPSSPRAINPGLPPQLQKVILKAIEKDRAARFQSASELHVDLARLSHELQKKHMPALLAAGILIAAVAVVGTVIWYRRSPTPPSPAVRYRQITTNSPENPVSGGAISPDGKYLVYSDVKGLHLKTMETDEVRAIPQPPEFDPKIATWEIIAWLADGKRFFANLQRFEPIWSVRSSENSSIWVVSALGGMPQKIRDHVAAYAVSPDGSQIAFAGPRRGYGESEIWLMDADGQHPHKLLDAPGSAVLTGFAWTEDKNRFIYIQEDQPDQPVMYSRDIAGGPTVTIFPPAEMRNLWEQLWLRDGRYVYAVKENDGGVSCNYWARRIDWRTGKRLDTPRQLGNLSGMCVFGGSVTTDDKHLVFQGVSHKVTVHLAEFDSKGIRIRQSRDFTPDSSGFVMDWTLDSKSIVYTSFRNTENIIYKQRIDEDSPGLVVAAPGNVHGVHLSPDDTWVLWTSYPKADPHPKMVQLMRARTTGGSAELLFPVHSGTTVSCAKLPSTLCILAEPAEHGNQVIIEALDPVKGRGAELARYNFDPAENSVAECQLAPDGSRVAAIPSPNAQIQIISLRGKPARNLPTENLKGKVVVTWSADGQGLFFVHAVKDGSELVYLDLRSNNLKPLWTNKGGIGPWARQSPDGRHLAIQGMNTNSNMWMMENF